MTRWSEYKVRFGIKGKTLQFSIAFATENGNGWFGIGFGPSDNGMTDADFIIGRLSSGSASLGNYISKGYQPNSHFLRLLIWAVLGQQCGRNVNVQY